VETAILGIREILGEHKGEDLSSIVLEVVREYEIEDKLGWFMSDNVGNNDTALRNLNVLLQKEEYQGFDIDERRLHCLGHIINLAIKLLLFNGNLTESSNDFKLVVAEVQEDVPTPLKNARIKEWRARGVVGRLHNVVLYIRASTQCRNKFMTELEIEMKKLPASMVYLDNDTRWSSTYDMIRSAVKNRARLTWYMQQTPGVARRCVDRRRLGGFGGDVGAAGVF
jgi:hypothetical protein